MSETNFLAPVGAGGVLSHSDQYLADLSSCAEAATLRISDVLRELEHEFVTVTSSKLRFLEVQGLIEPARTAAGYRMYSGRDLARLRFVLRQQRDLFLPLRVIATQLDALDRGATPLLQGIAAPSSAEGAAGSEQELNAAEERMLESYRTAGLIAEHSDVSVPVILELGERLASFGVEARHLGFLQQLVKREVELVQKAAAGQSKSRDENTEDAIALANDLVKLHTELLRAAINTALD